MHVIFQQEELGKLLQVTARGLATKTTIPILTGILIETQENYLRCVATDLEMAIEVKLLNVQILKPGSMVLPGKTFVEIIRHLPPGPLVVELNESINMVSINSNRSAFQLPLLPSEEFPALPEAKTETTVKINSEKIKEAIKQTIYATLAEDPRPFLSSVLWEFDASQLRLVATDVNRLAIKEIPIVGGERKTALVPVRALREIANIFGNCEDEVTIELADKMIFFKGSGVTFSARLVEAQFPRYEQVIPKDFFGILSVNRNDLIAALERTSLVSFSIKMVVNEGQLIITAKEPDKGRSYEEVAIDLTGPKLEIGFNARFLLDFLKAVDYDQIFFKYNQEQKPAVLQSSDNEDYRYVLMPLKLTV